MTDLFAIHGTRRLDSMLCVEWGPRKKGKVDGLPSSVAKDSLGEGE